MMTEISCKYVMKLATHNKRVDVVEYVYSDKKCFFVEVCDVSNFENETKIEKIFESNNFNVAKALAFARFKECLISAN